MVGIVIVSHSHELASGVRALALQMCRGTDVVIAAAGGLEDGTIGTSFDRIEQAIKKACSEDGVLVLMDLGSAVMTAQMVVEMLYPEQQARVRLCNAPLVEGAVAAAAAAAAGQSLDAVQGIAERVLDKAPKIETEAAEAAGEKIIGPPVALPEQTGCCASVDVTVPNPVGLHARPAMQFVNTASRFHSEITLQNLTRMRAPGDAKMPMQVAFGGTARQGEQVRIEAAGTDAEAAVAALRSLVESGFGEMDAIPPPLPPADTSSPETGEIPKGPPPRRMQGIGVSDGYAVATAFVHLPNRSAGQPSPAADPAAPQEEILRLHKAITEAKSRLERLQEGVESETDENTGRIFAFQRMLLEDAEVVARMEAEIRTGPIAAERAVGRVFAAWKDRAGQQDETMRARMADLQDVENRVLRVLGGDRKEHRIAPELPSIVVAADLTPSDVAQLDRNLVLGFATAAGGAASHTAILARTWGIPAVAGLGEAVLSVAGNTRIALDGTAGVLEVDPSDETIADYRNRADRLAAFRVEVLEGADRPASTRDGKAVPVLANAGDPSSVREALRCGADGIGLLRTEFLFLNRSVLPGEEEQYRVYRNIVEMMENAPVVMRTLDAGGDKPLPGAAAGFERNPFLGVRAIRLCLKRPELFQTQLRAMLRAAAAGNVKIMFPMIATLKEVTMAKAALHKAGRSLAREGLSYASDMEVGIMIETPAAAVNADILAREVDFLSIGTNDLTQYTLACDRDNRNLGDLYDTRDPAVLRLIRRTIDSAHAAGKPVSVCGEFAGEEQAVPLLLGLGLDAFSVAPARLPAVKHWIRQLDGTACREKAGRLVDWSLD